MAIQGMGPGAFRDAVLQVGVFTVTATIPSTATTVNGFIGSVACPGVRAGDQLLISPVAAQTAGVSFQAEVTANDVIAITASNGSAGAYNPGAQSFVVIALRPKTA